MFLITSGAYVSPDLVSEIGQLPPSFLPVGNKRLFCYQLEEIAATESDIFLSLPEDFILESHDQSFLDQHGVTIIPVPTGLSLGESILYCWNSTGNAYQQLQILHGDTLICGADFNLLDYVSIAQNKGYYHRATVSRGNLMNGSIEDAWAGDDTGYCQAISLSVSPICLSRGWLKTAGILLRD
ncbi:hypothetical protein [Endozoicomonas sp. ALC020]|uniref:hypothetical protein n=1 Tax=unclassified Endozoicomonas TaxID=2644528 RepID=UPI003BB127CD